MSETVEARPLSPLASPDPWNLVVDGYDEITRPFLGLFSRSGLARLHYGLETRVIDIACGPGTTTLLLSPVVKHVTCVDFSAGMLAQLRRNAALAGATNLDIVDADGQALPFEDGSFDLGVSMFGLMFFPDRAKGFAELHRVLVPGGQALVSGWLPAEQSPFYRVVFAALQPDDTPPQPTQPLSTLEDRDVFEAEMHAAGFADIRIEAVTHGFDVDDVERFWDDIVRAMAPVTMMKHNSSPTEWSKIEGRALDRLRRSLEGQLPATLSTSAWLATARKG